MSGITGIFDFGASTTAAELEHATGAMAAALGRGGSGAEGVWCDAAAGVGLGFRGFVGRSRSAEQAEHGAQPLASGCGRCVCVLDGELYNRQQLQRELRGGVLRESSDAEVLCEGISAWGLDGFLERANGVFAFALWDARERRLHLVRDRLGERPLFYGLVGRHVVFGSQLWALRAHPSFAAPLDRAALALFLRCLYIPGPYTPYDGIRKLPPGSVVTVKASASAALEEPRVYWSATRAALAGAAEPFQGTPEEAAEELEALLAAAVALRSATGGPAGALLSGGVHSSAVAAMAQRDGGEPVRTLTVTIGEVGLDRTAPALAVAEALGCAHTEISLPSEAAVAAVGELATVCDEPFADPSQLLTLLLARAASEHIEVALTGDGGDEVFGCGRYASGALAWRLIESTPRLARAVAARTLAQLAAPSDGRPAAALAQRLRALGGALDVDTPLALYDRLTQRMDFGAPIGDAEFAALRPALEGLTAEEQIMAWSAVTTLPDRTLIKVYRAGRHAGLRVRAPLLDHRLYEFAWRLDRPLGTPNGAGKALLRSLLASRLPLERGARSPSRRDQAERGARSPSRRDQAERGARSPSRRDQAERGARSPSRRDQAERGARSPSRRDHVLRLTADRRTGGQLAWPLAAWLRGELKDWAAQRVHADALRRNDIAAQTFTLWDEHQTGKRDHGLRLWSLALLADWLERALDERPSGPARRPTVVAAVPVEKLEIRPLQNADLPGVRALLSTPTGPGTGEVCQRLHRWKHADGPFGRSFGWVATDDDRVLAVLLLMRWRFRRHGQLIAAARAVDAAVHPSYRDRGLLCDLFRRGLDELAEAETAFVFATPDDAGDLADLTRPDREGLGWERVGGLPLAVHARSPAAAKTAWSTARAEPASLPTTTGVPALELLDELAGCVPMGATRDQLVTDRSLRFLRWRYGLQALGYRAEPLPDGGGGILFRLRRRDRAVELVVADVLARRLVSADELHEALRGLLRDSGAPHAVSLAPAETPASQRTQDGFLAWHAVTGALTVPPLGAWALSVGDIELFQR